ncbi:membrane-associated guanylate kinase, WW and PDZ domain-containing protein 2-like isoform X2 [Rhincodon typus]|uniref:membrane-associated guanylate kinase, WW and PDZ domain-containing protein 2-like isoform X2 n=1 Tax=Rhincodon typus TaxID=259920 RepID=UPI00202EE169|nr:membrane-associated guanylate kinase, WW and PDZ domain-containing protein 2-like isoform X2 [Rhincodon typus]
MLRKLLNISHWTQKTREATLCRDEEGFLNLRLLGGAEYGQLLYIGECQRGVARLESGKLHAGDLLLEVNEAPVSGLTLRDALDLLADIPDPVRIKTVPQGSQLNSDLRHFLKQVFTKGSADFDLQEHVRHNLYIRTLPWNYYGIPVPPILPTDATLTLDPSMLGCPPRSPSFPSVTEKRPNREAAHGSQGHSSAPGAAANISNGHVTSSNTNQNMAPAGEVGTEQQGIPRQPEEWVQATAETERTQTEPNTGQDSLLVPDVSQMLGYSVFATITKTNNTFGFTIAGGNRPSELLQIVSVAVGGPAEQTGNVQIVAGTQPLTEPTIHLADGSAQAQTGGTEGRNGDRNGCQGFSAGSKPQDVAAPCALGLARTGSSEPRHIVPGQHEEHELFESTPPSSLVKAGDEASLASSLNPRKSARPADRDPTERQEGDARLHLEGRPHGDKGAGSKEQLGSRGRDGASSKYDSREGDRRARSLSKPRDIPGISSRHNVCDLQPDGVRLAPPSSGGPQSNNPRPTRTNHEEPKEAEFYTVDLERSPTGFGFSVRGGREYDMDLYILGMIVGGPAMRSGKIRIGDQLVEINGEPTVGMSHARAVELIRHGQDKIHLLMRCGNGQVPEFGPDAVSRPDLGEVTVVPVRQEHPARGAARGQARPQSHHPRALLSSGPEHPTTRQGRLSKGQSQAADARPVAGSARGHRRNRRNQQGDDSGPETDLRPRSRALRDHSRQQ